MNTHPVELRPASDFIDAMHEEMSRKRLVTIEDGHFVVHDPELYSSTYEIPVDLCSTRDDLLRWLRQLAEKRWVTLQVIHDFVEAAIRQFGVVG